MKHWTEPNGIMLMHIPIEWQYINPAIKELEEKSPYSFQPYDDPIGCFQLSCYPLKDMAPGIVKKYPNGVKDIYWKETRKDDIDFCVHMYFCAYHDQALIGKYIYSSDLKGG